jgi:hypothetical protein
MHKSTMSGFIIDCSTGDLSGAATFWSAALGMQKQDLPGAEGKTYARLVDPNSDYEIEVQIVPHPSRVHLDIEADDIEAEVKRLETLGAKRIEHVKGWWVMEAPTGHRFCVVSAKDSKNFESRAKTWS